VYTYSSQTLKFKRVLDKSCLAIEILSRERLILYSIRFKIKFANLCEHIKDDETPRQTTPLEGNIFFRTVSLTLWFKIQFVTLCEHIKMKRIIDEQCLCTGTLLALRSAFGFPAAEHLEA
jgi:hypothetical protein